MQSDAKRDGMIRTKKVRKKMGIKKNGNKKK
jgi:hypothetical protein